MDPTNPIDAGALAAVTAAIESNGEEAPPPPDDTTDEGAAGAGADGGDGDAAAAAAAAAGDAGEASEEGETETAEEAEAAVAAGETRERDAHGRFLPKAKAAAKPDAAAAAAAAAAAGEGKGKKPVADIDPATGKPRVAAKKPDHVNDPIPEDVKGRTKERIESLIAHAKDTDGKLAAANEELTDARELVGMIDATGATPDTFARHMNVLALMHSPKVEDKQAVLGYLRKAADALGAQLGETPAGKNALEGHQDLIDEVEGGTLTEQRAKEIADHRNKTAAAAKLTKEAGERQNTETAEQLAIKKTTEDLNAFSARMRKKDGPAVYARKHRLLVPFIKPMRMKLAPDELLPAVQAAYDAIELGPAVTDKSARVGDQGGKGGTLGEKQPLRPKQGAGGAPVKEPGSALDAMNNALAELGGARG